MIRGSGGSKSRLAKTAGGESCGQRRNEKLHAAVARSAFSSQNVQNTPALDHFLKLGCGNMGHRCGAKHLQVKMLKTVPLRTTFGSSDVEKWHETVGRSAFASQNHKKLTVSGHLDVRMWKNGTKLWREAHLQFKMLKLARFRALFGSSDVEKWHAAVARSTFSNQHAQNTSFLNGFGSFLNGFGRFGCRKGVRLMR